MTVRLWLLPLTAALTSALMVAVAGAADPALSAPAKSPYAAWKHGPPADENYFPIAVWLQDPKMAPRYKAAGINLYVGLWKGPTEEQLAALKAAGMPVICDQNAVGLKHKDDATIIGWMHGDEPDNAQSLGEGKGYGPPIPPEKIVADYERLRTADPTRPVLLNLGQGVAWDGWYGRGVRTNHPEDYPEYAKGGDIVSFDIYPVAHPKPEVQGKLWYVARGVERLVGWAGPAKAVWNCIECTRISSDSKATPAQVRAEVWMSLVRGSRGLIWFVHEWKPKFNEHALLDDAEMLAAVTAINAEIRALAPVLNAPHRRETMNFPFRMAGVPLYDNKPTISWLTARYQGATYVFAVNESSLKIHATFGTGPGTGGRTAEVLGENRSVKVNEKGEMVDDFEPYGVHLYRIGEPSPGAAGGNS